MIEYCDTELIIEGVERPGDYSEAALRLPHRVSQLEPGRAVFQIGDPKDFIFRVESGTIGISGKQPSGASELIEEIGSGVVFGLGFLDAHVYDAIALSESVVSCWSKDALPFLEGLDPTVQHRCRIETEREFVHRRTTLVAAAPKLPYRRLAGFLCVASRLNDSQGRDPCVIDESVDCASVAAFLRIDFATLEQAIVELRKRGLITHEPPRGIRIVDLEALQSLASDEHPLSEGVVPSSGAHA